MSLKETFSTFHNSYIEWFKARKPKDILRSAIKLGEETGEVCEAIAAMTGSKSKIEKFKKQGKTPRGAVIEELGDVVVVCLNIATLCNISHMELFDAASKKARSRAKNVRDRKRSK